MSPSTATRPIYTLSLHDALPISRQNRHRFAEDPVIARATPSYVVVIHTRKIVVNKRIGVDQFYGRSERQSFIRRFSQTLDRKSTRLNSSHANISYAVFCLKKKKK